MRDMSLPCCISGGSDDYVARALLPANLNCYPASILLISDHEIYGAGMVGVHRHRFLPGPGLGEHGALHGALGQDIVGLLFARETPAFMPRDNLIRAGRNAGELKASALIGDGVIAG